MMSTGMKNAPVYGQNITYEIYEETDVTPVQDDCFGGGKTKKECVDNFINALELASQNNIKVSPKEIGCCVDEVKAVGYKVNNKGIIPLPRNTTKALATDIDKIKI